MDVYEINDIFTPTKPARKNFIKRKTLDKRVERGLKTPGMQVVLYGHSGSGKTTLLLNKLKQLNLQYLKTNCTSNMSFDDLLSNVFVNLKKELSIKEIDKEVQEGGGRLKIPTIADFSSKETTDLTTEKNYASAYDSIELSLARAIGEYEAIWVIEDFHKLNLDVKAKLSQLMKVFMDLSDDYSKLKVVALGAKNTAREVVELDSEMQTRVSEIHVPLMTDDEIYQIVDKGTELLNISVEGYVKDSVVEHSHGVASICHQLCLLMCEFADIDKTNEFDSNILLDYEHFNYSASEYIQQVSDTLKAAFQKAIKINNSYEILLCLSDHDIEGAEVSDILSHVNTHNDKVEITLAELNEPLAMLSNIDHGSVLLFDEVSETYSFKDPFYKMFAKLFLKEISKKKKPTAKELHNLFNTLILQAKRSYSNPSDIVSRDNDTLSKNQPFEDESERLKNKWKKTEYSFKRKPSH